MLQTSHSFLLEKNKTLSNYKGKEQSFATIQQQIIKGSISQMKKKKKKTTSSWVGLKQGKKKTCCLRFTGSSERTSFLSLRIITVAFIKLCNSSWLLAP
jgi:hypothetical protein